MIKYIKFAPLTGPLKEGTMVHLNADHRRLYRNTFCPLALLATLVAAVVAITRTAKTGILANHQLPELTSEQLSVLATISLQVLFWLLIVVGFMAGTIMAFVLYHQHTTLHHKA